MSKRIAPCLSAFFIDTTMGPAISLAQVHTMRAELRALLAVARAAKRVAVSGSDWDGNMVRALSRLQKVSEK